MSHPKGAKWQWRVTSDEEGMRLQAFLKEKCLQAPSVKSLKRAIDGKCCTVNRRIELRSSLSLKAGDTVALSPDAFQEEDKKSAALIPLYEDGALFICNKPSGVVSENAALRSVIPQWGKNWAVVHRLDKETTGALIIAKTSTAKEKMLAAFKERQVEKIYLAIVDGIPGKEQGKVDNSLDQVRTLHGQPVYGAVDPKKGKRAVTHWKCLKKGKNAALIWCQPITGRTHQIRVHLSGIGHPILGDVLYGKKFRCSLQPKRNLLHAYQIQFPHPTSGKKIKVVAPIPSDFQAALKRLEMAHPVKPLTQK
ncbi:MAG: RluA family pseudouridine synthase [Chlamydiota bacterium]